MRLLRRFGLALSACIAIAPECVLTTRDQNALAVAYEPTVELSAVSAVTLPAVLVNIPAEEALFVTLTAVAPVPPVTLIAALPERAEISTLVADKMPACVIVTSGDPVGPAVNAVVPEETIVVLRPAVAVRVVAPSVKPPMVPDVPVIAPAMLTRNGDAPNVAPPSQI